MVAEIRGGRPDGVRARCSPRSNSISAASRSGAAMAAPRSAATTALPARLELRFDQKLSLRYLSGYQLYGFVDSGVAWNDGYRLTRRLCRSPRPAAAFASSSADGLQADIGAAAPLSYRAP